MSENFINKIKYTDARIPYIVVFNSRKPVRNFSPSIEIFWHVQLTVRLNFLSNVKVAMIYPDVFIQYKGCNDLSGYG